MLSLRAFSKSRALSLRALSTNATPAHYSSRLLAAANHGRLSEALDIAVAMKQAGVSPDKKAYEALLTSAADLRCWLFAWAIFDDMIKAGFEPTTSTIVPLLQAQNERPYSNRWAVFDVMKQRNIQPTSAVYSAILDGHIKQGTLESALRVYLNMKRAGVILELPAAQKLVTSCAISGYSRLAFDIATQYEAESTRSLPEHVWVEVLACAAKNFDHDTTKKAWALVYREREGKITEYIALGVLNTAVRATDSALATEVLQALEEIGVAWREHHFGALIQALCGAKQFQEAFISLKLMRDEGLPATDITFTTVADAIGASVEDLDAAWDAVDKIWQQRPQHLDISALKAVMKAALALGDLQRVVGIYKGFEDYGMVRDVPTYNMMLEAAVGAAHRQLGDLVLDDMKAAKAKPDVETFEKTIRLCLTQDTYEDAFYYLEEMKAAGFVPPQSTYEAILAKCVSEEDPRTPMVLEEMKECGYRALDQRAQLTAKHTQRQARRSQRSSGPTTREGYE